MAKERAATLETIASEIEGTAPPAREDIPTAPTADGSVGAGNAPGAAPPPAPGALTDRSIGALDRLGRSFDRKLHHSTPDGTPILTKKGALSIKGGRPAGMTGGGSVAPPLPGQSAQQAADAARFRSTAAVTVQSFASVATMLGGETWEPSAIEKAQLTDAWAEYYRVRGIRDVPPEVMLGAVMGSWAFGTPERRDQLRGVAARLQARLIARRNKPDARTHYGPNSGGQEHVMPAADRPLP